MEINTIRSNTARVQRPTYWIADYKRPRLSSMYSSRRLTACPYATTGERNGKHFATEVGEENKHGKQVRQQACKTQIPPYGLKQRRRPQFRMPMPCTDAVDPPEPFIPEVMPPPPWLPASQSSPKGEKTCPGSRPACMRNFTPLPFFPPLRNP